MRALPTSLFALLLIGAGCESAAELKDGFNPPKHVMLDDFELTTDERCPAQTP